MKIRQRDKIVKAWHQGRRLAWKRSTIAEARRPYVTPDRFGGWLLPRYVARALERYWELLG